MDKKRTKMRNVTIHIPDNYLDNMDKLISAGIIRNRSEGVRIALKEYLQRLFGDELKVLGFNVNFKGNGDNNEFKVED